MREGLKKEMEDITSYALERLSLKAEMFKVAAQCT